MRQPFNRCLSRCRVLAIFVVAAVCGAEPLRGQTCFSYVNTPASTPLRCVQQGDLTTPCSWDPDCHEDGDTSDCCTTVPASSPQTVREMHEIWHKCFGNIGDQQDASNPPQRGQRWYAFHRQIEIEYNLWRESGNFCDPTAAAPQGCKIESVDWCPNMPLPYGYSCNAAASGTPCGGSGARANNVPCPTCQAFPHCLFLGGGGPQSCANAPSNSCTGGVTTFPFASLEQFKTVEQITTILDASFHGNMHGAVGASGACTDINNPSCSVRDPMFWRLHKAIDDIVRAWQNVNATDVMLVLDRSGSMNETDLAGGTKLQRAIEAADLFASLVDSTRPDGQTNRLGLVSYSDAATDPARNMGITTVTPTLRNPGQPFPNALAAITSAGGGGCTGIGGAVQTALDQLCPSGDCSQLPTDPPAGENRRKAILLLTDGVENVSPCLQSAGATGPACSASCFGSQIDYTHLFDAQVCAVGFGDAGSLNGDLLTIFAERQGGIYMQNPAADPDGEWIDLKDFFAKCFGQLSDEFLGLDPQGTLPADQGATEIVEYSSCGDQQVTFVSGWKDPIGKGELRLLVNAPSGDLVRAVPGASVETSTERTWDFARVLLPYRGSGPGTWQAQLVRPHRQFVNGFTTDSFARFEEGVALVRREIQRLCADGCANVLFFEHKALGPSVYDKALEIERAAGLVGAIQKIDDPRGLLRLLDRRWDLLVYARQGGQDRPEPYDDFLARRLCEGQRAIVTDTRVQSGATVLRCAGVLWDGTTDHRVLAGGPALVPGSLDLRNPGHPISSYGLRPIATEAQGFFGAPVTRRRAIGVVAKVDKGIEHDWFLDVLVRGLARLEPHKPVSHVRTGDDLLPTVRMLPSFVPAGGWSRVDARVEIERPLVGLNTVLTRYREKTPRDDRSADSKDPRAQVLTALERSRRGPIVPTDTDVYPLYDDGTHGDLVAKNAYWSAQLPDLARADGMYRYRFMLDFEKDGCTTRRELVQSVFVEVGVDPSASSVTVGPAIAAGAGRSRYDVRILPRDALGNMWGFGRPGPVTCGPANSCTCDASGVTDHGEGSYTIPVQAAAGANVCELRAFGARFDLQLARQAQCSSVLKTIESAKIESDQLRHRLLAATRRSCGPLLLQRTAAAAAVRDVLHELESHAGEVVSPSDARAIASRLRAVAPESAVRERQPR
ncbi:MAG TPA: vWA domain-containing protein [Thermoanaerobaculia bacterium]|nr:vWA domain-containing protein [Thermoanaerobaculia bacterium]